MNKKILTHIFFLRHEERLTKIKKKSLELSSGEVDEMMIYNVQDSVKRFNNC